MGLFLNRSSFARQIRDSNTFCCTPVLGLACESFQRRLARLSQNRLILPFLLPIIHHPSLSLNLWLRAGIGRLIILISVRALRVRDAWWHSSLRGWDAYGIVS